MMRKRFYLGLWMILSNLPVMADEPPSQTRIIATGWNSPTVAQFVRDQAAFGKLPFDGAVIEVQEDTGNANPFHLAHAAEPWQDVRFSETEKRLDSLDATAGQSSYLLIRANPGDADWCDDQAWEEIVDHWRLAARLAKRGKLRGLVFDPEPYEAPWEQFRFSVQEENTDHTIQQYRAAARTRGREVMRAVEEEFPSLEILSYFWMSYLVRDHRYRGPSPIDAAGDRRPDFDWCLAAHRYGLLPGFMSGMLDVASETTSFVDGCEYGYWLTDPNDFAELARHVRLRGRHLVDADVREKYDRQVRVAFPIFIDIIHPTLLPEWTLRPESTDRLSVLRQQLTSAITAGDGLVWLYSERGRWWPDPTDTSLWPGKDVFPSWPELIPGCLEVIREVRSESLPRSLKWEQPESPNITYQPMEIMKLDPWESWIESEDLATEGNDDETNESVAVDRATVLDKPNLNVSEVSEATNKIIFSENEATITGVENGVAMRSFVGEPGQHYQASVRVRQEGRGQCKLVIRFRDQDGKWLQHYGVEAYSYPSPGVPEEWRTMFADAQVPPDAAHVVIVLVVAEQFSGTDKMVFDSIEVRRIDITESKHEK